MEFIDPIVKQKHKKRLAIGYMLLVILVSLATYILIATAMGYQVFQSSGQVVQNGILFLDSEPVSADIYLNNNKESNKTDTRLTLSENDYEVTLRAEGYKDWTKRISVNGGKVSFINYPRLFPRDFKTTDLKAYEGKENGFLTQSPDKRWILFQDKTSSLEINLIDTSKENIPQQSLSVPTSVVGSTDGKIGIIKVLEWSADSKSILVEHNKTDGSIVFAIINREDVNKSVNINLQLNIKPTKVSLVDGKADRVYLYLVEGGVIKIGDLRNKSIGEQIFDQVVDFKQISGNRLIYATTKNATTGKVTINAFDGSKEFFVGEVNFDPNNHYILEAAEFSGDWYYALGSKSSDKVRVYKNPQNFSDSVNDKKPTVLTTLRAGKPEYVKFSPQNRFLLMQSANNFSVYDSDTKTSYRVNLPNSLDQGTSIQWLSEFLIQYSIGGKLYVSEFDGKNIREIIAVKPPYLGFIDTDFKRLYSFKLINNVLTSQSTKLTVD